MVGVKNMNTLLAMYLIAIRDTVGWHIVTYVVAYGDLRAVGME